MRKIKIGRNDPCPCGKKQGNGKPLKYKRCCEDKQQKIPQITSEVLTKMLENLQPEPFEKGGFLTGRKFVDIAILEEGVRVRAVGPSIHRRPINETFHIFLFNILADAMGQEWYNENSMKAKKDWHPMFEWVVELKLALQNDPVIQPNKIMSVELTGNLRALLAVAYDFYSLQHCGATVLPNLIKRLKNNRQFQGARYEIAVGGLVVRSGFEIEWINDKGKHCEFIGTHKITNEKVAFEAKSHHREGVFGEAGEFKPKKSRIKIFDHIREALEQSPRDIPLVIFDDLNLPISEEKDASNIPWFDEIDKQLRIANFYEDYKETQWGGLIVTNFSWHFHPHVPEKENETIVYFHSGSKFSLNPETVRFLDEASKQYGFVPPKVEELEHLKTSKENSEK